MRNFIFILFVLCSSNALSNFLVKKDTFDKYKYYNTYYHNERYFNKEISSINIGFFAYTFNGKVLQATQTYQYESGKIYVEVLKFDSSGNIIERSLNIDGKKKSLKLFEYENNLIKQFYEIRYLPQKDTAFHFLYKRNSETKLTGLYRLKGGHFHDSLVYNNLGDKIEHWQKGSWGLGKEFSITKRFEYDSNRILRREIKYSYEGDISEETFYNKFGDQIKLIVQQNYSTGLIEKVYNTKYNHDSNNIMINSDYFNNLGDFRKTKSFHSNGVIRKSIVYRNGDIDGITEYDSKGRETKRSSGKTTYFTNQYIENEQGILIEQIQRDGDGKIEWKKEFDLFGNMIKISWYTKNTVTICHTIIDKHGNEIGPGDCYRNGVKSYTAGTRTKGFREYSYIYLE